MKQDLNISVCLLAVVLSLGSSAAMAAGGYRVTRAQEAQIKIGMTDAEVRNALGKPSRIYKYRNEVGPTWTYEVLGTNSATVYEVDFDKDSKVIKINERERWDAESFDEISGE